MNQIDPIAYAAVIDDMHARLAKANKENQRLIHEAERLASTPLTPPPPARIFPVQVRCDRRGCASVVAFDPAPEESRLAAALVALGWGVSDGHYCPGCLKLTAEQVRETMR